MARPADERNREILGRDDELSQLATFVADEQHERALVISGGPGIGKTTLWEAAVTAASTHGFRVLRARAAEAERMLTFATLADLFEDVHAADREELPEPQRHALDVALLREEPTDAPPEQRAIALGVLNTLRSLAAEGPVLLAIDDVQWADRASIEAVAFAARRLADAPVHFLLAKRPSSPTLIEHSLALVGVDYVTVDGLSLGAVRRLLTTRLDLSLSHRVVRQVFDLTLGNPLFALEIGRTFRDRAPPAIGEELLVPDSLDELLGTRTAVSSTVRRTLLCLALGGGVSREEMTALNGADALNEAVEAGLVVAEGDRLRPSHPLMAAAVVKRASACDRRELHRELAGVVSDPVRSARHLALAETREDSVLAARVALGAASAGARGAREQAIELSEHALRLTPAFVPERAERVLALGEHLHIAGEGRRLRQLLEQELDSLPAGPARAQGHLLLARVPISQDEYDHQLDRAVAESADAPALRASVLAEQSLDATVSWLERLDEAEDWALEARRLAGNGRSAAEALQAVAWVRILRGRSIEDLGPPAGDAPSGTPSIPHSLERVKGIQLAFRGVVDDARAIFLRELARADEHGQQDARDTFLHQLCELELRAGRCAAAARVLEEKDPSLEIDRPGLRSHAARLAAVLAAVRGDPRQAEERADETVALALGQRWDLLEADRARGVAALAAREPARAVEALLRVWQHTQREGIDDPGAFPVAPDLVEALLQLDDLPQAQAVTDRLAHLAEEQEHPWGLASAKRSRALVHFAADADAGEAPAALLEAADEYGRLGLAFDRARTLLALGRHMRRRRKWAAARRALEQAAGAFDHLGGDGWAEHARAELARVGGRRPRGAADLTPTERRVAELAAGGRSNKEIAHTLFVSIHTIEVHLSRVYAKLNVRSRGHLTDALATQAGSPPQS